MIRHEESLRREFIDDLLRGDADVAGMVERAGLPAPVIAKTQTRSSLLRATRVLLAVRRAAELGGIDSFAVPRPVRLDARRQLLFLEELPAHRDARSVRDVRHRLGR